MFIYFSFAPMGCPPHPIAGIMDWVARLLSHAVETRDWPAFVKRYGLKVSFGKYLPLYLSSTIYRRLLIRLFMMAGRRASRRRAPDPAFRQVVAFARMQFTLDKSAREGRAQLVQARETSWDMVVREETSYLPIHHLVKESSNGDKSLLRKKGKGGAWEGRGH